MAIEDIGLADPQALVIANAAKDAYDFLGSPEGELAIAQAAVYLAVLGCVLFPTESTARNPNGSDAAPSLLDHAEPTDRVLVANSFSKTWAMTGWRLGWLVVPEELFEF